MTVGCGWDALACVGVRRGGEVHLRMSRVGAVGVAALLFRRSRLARWLSLLGVPLGPAAG